VWQRVICRNQYHPSADAESGFEISSLREVQEDVPGILTGQPGRISIVVSPHTQGVLRKLEVPCCAKVWVSATRYLEVRTITSEQLTKSDIAGADKPVLM
jgi:hypothetical protein